MAKYDISFSPRSAIEDAMLGWGSENIHDNKLFSCLGCYACSLRCPTDVDFPAFVRGVRSLAFGAGEQGCPAHGGFLHSVARLMSRSPYKQER
ncbi:MAG: hypothetical protein ACLFVD_07055, partial [Dehalococcoidia bacterium]